MPCSFRYQSPFRYRHLKSKRPSSYRRLGIPWESTFSRKSRHERQIMISNPWTYPIASMHVAAIQIQKHMRGYQSRRNRSRAREVHEQKQKHREDCYFRLKEKFNDQLDQPRSSYEKHDAFDRFCSDRIKAWWKMLRPRQYYCWYRFDIYAIAAHQIQRTWKSKSRLSGFHAVRKAASETIQHAWKSYGDRRVFHYYQNLVNFRHTGDPREMLRAINPAEASLLDAASGAHVRFRLGGEAFPPTMYYKIFLRQPVCDLGAFSPKDYSRRASSLGQQRKEKKTKCIQVGQSRFQTRTGNDDDDDGSSSSWYQRVENNGWRPITTKVISEAAMDPVAVSTGQTVVPFHYSRTTRRQDLEQRRVLKKRNWLKQMYARGAREEREEMATTTEPGEDTVDDLLHWSDELNFDAYVDSWATLATSNNSSFSY